MLTIKHTSPLPTLEAKNICATYKGRTILSNVNLRLRKGEVVGLLGPNGAGKTTFFSVIAGLASSDSGNIFLGNVDITDIPMYLRARLGVRYLLQGASVFHDMTVENNLLAILELVFRDNENKLKKLQGLLDEFDLNPIRHTKAKALSGGERRRLEIARCLIGEPSFILLDEPLAGIDPKMTETVMHLILLLKKKNIGILITDHNALETFTIADRVYILNNGHIVKEGSPENVANEPSVRKTYLGTKFRL